MLAAVEDHMLPDLIANRDRVELPTEPRQQFEVFAGIDDGGGLSGLLNSTALVLWLKTPCSASSVSRQCGGSSRTGAECRRPGG